MRSAGYCDTCQRNVYLDEWACGAGHDWSHISGWYNSETGEPVTPPWLDQQQSPPATTVSHDPPIDPAGAILELVGRRLSALGLTVAAEPAALSITREAGYEARVTADRDTAHLAIWEHLANGDDPGVRDLVRGTAVEAGWNVQVTLRRPASSG